MASVIWLRSEINADERRAPLSPADSETLIKAGFKGNLLSINFV